MCDEHAPLVFISYRIDDAKLQAHRLFDRLQAEFGREAVFLDRKSIDGGDTWTEKIRHGVEQARAVLVLVGPKWLTLQDAFGNRRLSLDDDWVRQEVATALRGRPQKLVLQVLVDAQPVPEQAVKNVPGIEGFWEIERTQLRSDDWDTDILAILSLLEKHGFRRQEPPSSEPPPKDPRRPGDVWSTTSRLVAGVVVLAVCSAAASVAIEAHAFATLLGLDIGETRFSLWRPFPFGVEWGALCAGGSLIFVLASGAALRWPARGGLGKGTIRAVLWVAAVLCIGGLAKLLWFDAPLLEVADALRALPVATLQQPASADSRTARTWRRIVCSRVTVADVNNLREQSGAVGPSPFECGPDVSRDASFRALSRQFWTTAGISVAIAGAWLLLFVFGGSRLWWEVAKGYWGFSAVLPLALAWLVALFSLATVPYSYAKLMRPTRFPVSADGTQYRLVAGKGDGVVCVISPAGVQLRLGSIEGGTAMAKDVFEEVFLRRLAEADSR